jgi:hypothetical protein
MEIKRREQKGANDLLQETKNGIGECSPPVPRRRMGCTWWMKHKPAKMMERRVGGGVK